MIGRYHIYGQGSFTILGWHWCCCQSPWVDQRLKACRKANKTPIFARETPARKLGVAYMLVFVDHVDYPPCSKQFFHLQLVHSLPWAGAILIAGLMEAMVAWCHHTQPILQWTVSQPQPWGGELEWCFKSHTPSRHSRNWDTPIIKHQSRKNWNSSGQGTVVKWWVLATTVGKPMIRGAQTKLSLDFEQREL